MLRYPKLKRGHTHTQTHTHTPTHPHPHRHTFLYFQTLSRHPHLARSDDHLCITPKHPHTDTPSPTQTHIYANGNPEKNAFLPINEFLDYSKKGNRMKSCGKTLETDRGVACPGPSGSRIRLYRNRRLYHLLQMWRCCASVGGN